MATDVTAGVYRLALNRYPEQASEPVYMLVAEYERVHWHVPSYAQRRHNSPAAFDRRLRFGGYVLVVAFVENNLLTLCNRISLT